MLTYASLLVGTITAIIGAFLSPRRRLPDGKEVPSRWAWLFVALPLISFSITAWGVKDKDAAAQRLQDKLDRSLRKVDTIDAEITFELAFQDIGFDERLKKNLAGLPIGGSINYRDKSGVPRRGISSELTDRLREINIYRDIIAAVDNGLARVSQMAPAVLMIARKGVVPGGLQKAVEDCIEMPFPGVLTFDGSKLPATVLAYEIRNPRSLDEILPVTTVLAKESWFLPDKDMDVIRLTWRLRFLNNRSLDLATQDDFADSEVVSYVPLPNPNRDFSPNFMALRGPVGKLVSLQVLTGMYERKWDGDAATANVRILRDSNGQNLGYVAALPVKAAK